MKVTTKRKPLPKFVRELLWEYEPGKISFPKDRHLVTKKVLAEGSWEAIRWLRRQIGDEGLRKWIVEHDAHGLSPEQLRFWQLVLRLDSEQVDKWIELKRQNPWYARSRVEKKAAHAS